MAVGGGRDGWAQAGRQESGRVTTKGSVESRVVSWTHGGRGPPKAQLIIFGSDSNEDASLRSTRPGRTISCHLADERYLPRARGSASSGRGAAKWKYLATIALRLPPRSRPWKLSSRPRTKRGISLRTMYQLARRSLSFPEMHSIFRCITLSRGNSLFYSVPKIDIGRSNFWFLSIVQTSRGPHKEPPSLNPSLHNRAQCISRFRGALKVGNSKLKPRRGLPKTRHQNWTRWTLFSGLPKHTFCPVYKLGDQPRHPRNHSLKSKRQTWDGWPKFCLPAVRWAASHHSSLTEPTSPGV